ncbi:MAG: indoleacetamide hydrolase [Dinoroseobacter sp.]|nr:indoleacetamide hydrolase [Dinoroseobacter sp.]
MYQGNDVCGLCEQLENRSISARELAEETIKREEDLAHLNAVSHFDPELVRQKASRSDALREAGSGGKLCGVPFVAKDNINTIAFPTTAGTPALEANTPESDASVVSLLKNSGAYVGGKAGMHELAFGITSNNSATGPVRNPWDPSKIPGGSSGGTASAVAAGIFPFGLGTDTGASVRLPSALCGAVGFRPTVGRYSQEGVVPISHTRDTVGAITRSMRDIALIDGILSNDDKPYVKVDLTDVVLGIPSEVFYEDLDPEVETYIQTALSALEKSGATLVDVSLAEIWPLNEAVGFPVALFEVMRDLPAYLEKHAPSVSLPELISKIASPDVEAVFESQLGEQAISEDAYLSAIREHRPAAQALYESVFRENQLNALVFPTSALRARDIGQDETVVLNGNAVPTFPTYIRNTDLGSNIGVPGISIPCPDVEGLPVGIEFEGLAGRDRDLIGLAISAERVFGT